MKETKEISLLELFSGIGGFAKGFQDAGYTIKKHLFSEIDKHAIANYKYNFKESEYVGSVTDVRGFRGQADVITFGSPCQDFSLAGKRAGMEGERSSLIMEAIRLITEIQPSVFIWENVKGAFSSNDGADFWAIIAAFANIGGYRLEWQLLNTSWFLPQNRERIYLIGHSSGRSEPGVFPITATDPRITKGTTETAIVRAITAGGHSGGHHSGMTLIKNLQGKEICNTIRSGGRGSLTDKHNWDMVQVKQINDKKNFGDSTKQQDRVYDPSGIMACLGSHSLESKCNIQVKPVLTPDRKEKRQNGRRFKENGEPAFTLSCQDQHGVQIDNSIRRLTEIECERLQGFDKSWLDGSEPTNWTKYGNYDGEIKEISKTQRYKMCGNAVTVDVVKAIAERLKIK
jgi:DNA (cytosine-5)-methyltransferase 1